MKRILTNYTGVYGRPSDTRTHNGRPDVSFDITYKVNGKKVWEKIGWASEGYTAKLASQIRADRLRSIRHGHELPQQKQKAPSFKDLAAKYLDWAKANKAWKGINDVSRYKNHLAPFFKDKRIDEISVLDLERFKSLLMDKGLAPATVKHCLVMFRQVVNKAIAWGLYEGANPIKGVKLPRLQNKKERFLTFKEAKQLLAMLAESSSQLHDMALLSLHCGLRAGEIFNIKGQDLNFENDLINIADPKNKQSRKAFMTEAVKEILQGRVPESPSEYVFKDKRHGGKIKAISRVFRLVVEDIGFNDGIDDRRQRVSFHTLRHTFASWLALQGETLPTIKELMGHKTLEMTIRYAHLMPDQKKRATAKLEKAFNQGTNMDSKF